MPADLSGDGPSAQTIMFHEYAHHMLLSSATEYYPRWLTEGMAEFFMVSRLNRDGSIMIGQIGRAHVCTPVTNAHLVCRLLLEKKKKQKQNESAINKTAHTECNT